MSDANQRLCLGVDAGGTRTVVLVGRPGQEPLGRGVAGPGNPQVVGFEGAAGEIERAIAQATTMAEAGTAARASRLVVGAAGAGRPADVARLRDLLAERLDLAVERITVLPDSALLLPAAGVASGVALIAGTGSSAFGVGRDGRVHLGGGWGYLIGDEGSAFQVGRDALKALALAEDGLAPETALTGALLAALGCRAPRAVVPLVYQAASPRTTIAALAPTVAEVARLGDPIARAIFAEAGSALGRLAAAVAERLGLGSAVVVGAGGLFRAGEVLLDPLRVTLARVGLTDFRLLGAEPALGALRLATGEVPIPVRSDGPHATSA